MGESDAVAVVGMFFLLLVYVGFSTLDLLILFGSDQRVPALLQQIHQYLVSTFSPRRPSKARTFVEFLTIVLVTQIVPVLLLTEPKGASILRTASVVELTLALAWTVYLVRVSNRGPGPLT